VARCRSLSTVLLDRFRNPRAAITLVFVLNGALYGSWAARIPAIQNRLDLSAGALGIALAGVATGALVAMPLSGGWAARAGSRRATRTLLAAACIAVPLASFAPSLLLLVLGTLALGASNGGLDVAMNAQGAAVERRAGRLIFSSLHAGFSFGGLVGALTGAAAAAAGVDVRVNLVVVGALALAIGLPVTRALLPASADASPEGHAFARPTRALWALGVLAFCCLLAEGAAADWSAVYVEDSLDAPAGQAALAFAAFSATMTLGRLAGDRLAGSLGSVRLLRISGLVAGIGLGSALLLAVPGAAIAGFAFLGAGLSVVIPIVFRSAAASPGGAAGPSLAAVSTLGYLGFLAGPPLVGGLAELTSLPVALSLVVLCAASTAALAGATRGVGSGVPAPTGSVAEPMRA
jgi:MFS family permease